MASTVPAIRGTAFDLYFFLYKNDGTLIANPGTHTRKVSKDGGAFADTTNDYTEVENTYGLCKLTLTATEMTADIVIVVCTDNTTGVVPFTQVIYTAAQSLDTVAGYIDTEVGTIITTLGTPAGASVSDDIAALSTSVAMGTPHFHYPSAYTKTVGGTPVGDYTALASHDESLHNTPEVNAGSGVAGIDVTYDITGITVDHTPTVLDVAGWYEGSPSHEVYCQMWNYTNSAWEQKFTMRPRTSAFDYQAGLTSDNVSGGAARVRFLHNAVTGSATHDLFLDMIRLSVVETTDTSAATIAATYSLLQDVDNEVDELVNEGVTVAAYATGLSPAEQVDTANLDVAVSTRLAASAYTAPSGSSASDIDAVLSATHGAGAWGPADETSDTEVTHLSTGDDAEVIGITTPGATISAYIGQTFFRRSVAEPDGEWSIWLTPGATYTLQFSKDGYYDAEDGDSVITREVTV